MRALIALLLLPSAAFAYDPAPVAAQHGMVVSAQHLATDVGVDILRHGGNAIDAAVAVGYALAVTYPAAGNLGGGGFMTLRLADGTTGFLDFREKAPLAATAGMFLDDRGAVAKGRSTETWLAVGIPGTPAGLEAARSRYGTLPRDVLLAPAIRLAREGFALDAGDLPLFLAVEQQLARDPAAAAIFLPGGHAPRLGDRLVQLDLARTLERLAQDGPDGFYRGPVADALVAASAAGGGLIRHEDLERYRVRSLAPITCDYRGYHMISAPPPSSGGVALCEMLTILEGYDLQALGFHSAAAVHLQAEAMRHAFIDRNNRLGDPDFVQNPVAELLDRGYAARVRAGIDPRRAMPIAPPIGATPIAPPIGAMPIAPPIGATPIAPPVGAMPIAPPVGATPSAPLAAAHEGANTTHFAVVDQAGNAVAVTYTLNDWFGVHKVVPGTGVVLNNEMDDFTAQPGQPNMFGLVQGADNAVAPGKTPLSSMTPTIVTRDGKLAMVLGSPGGPRIITTVLNVMLNLVDYGMTVQEAVDAPRLHHQALPDTLFAERFALSPDSVAILEAGGTKVTEGRPWGIAGSILIGGPRLAPQPMASGAQSLTIGNPAATGATLFGAADPRGGAGSAAGY